jgi:hypothetical protein
MKDDIKTAFLYLLCVVMFGVYVYGAWGYYALPCDQLKENPVLRLTYAPARCINTTP